MADETTPEPEQAADPVEAAVAQVEAEAGADTVVVESAGETPAPEDAPGPVEAAVVSPDAPGKNAAVDEAVEIVKTIAYALLIAFVLRVLLFQPFTIPSGSMIPNLLVGDYIIVSKYSYGYSKHSIPFSPPIFKGRIFGRQPHRGDVVVFKFPNDNRTDYIKRLIGLPGDRIQVTNGVVFLNGKAIPQKPLGEALEGFGSGTRIQETLPGGPSYVTLDQYAGGQSDDTGVYIVPQGYYFMMGDNRDNSSDSRVDRALNGVGFVPAENLVGKAQIILFSWNSGASLIKPWTWFTKARPSRFFHSLK